jgi:hypothetical protein
MKKNIYIAVLFSFVLLSCNKDETPRMSFNPTDFIISEMGAQMRLTIKVPTDGIYSFSADSSTLDSYGEGFYDHLVPIKEMESLALNLSDTVIFKWELMTAESPYPEDECELLVYSHSGPANFMCSIGKGNTASNIIHELATTLTGEAKTAFDEIAIILSE